MRQYKNQVDIEHFIPEILEELVDVDGYYDSLGIHIEDEFNAHHKQILKGIFLNDSLQELAPSITQLIKEYASDLMEWNWEIVETYDACWSPEKDSDMPMFPVIIEKFGPVYRVTAPEYDAIEFFASIEHARSALRDNYGEAIDNMTMR